MRSEKNTAYKLTFVGVMAAMVYVVTFFRFPLLGSKVHFANALCLLSGLLLGPWLGGLSAGIGSALYDALGGGYDLVNVLITLVSKFVMGFVCGKVLGDDREQSRPARTVTACVLGALSYVALYMLKSYVFQRFVYAYPPETIGAAMVSKLIPSLINAGLAVVAAPVFYYALRPSLHAGGLWDKLKT